MNTHELERKSRIPSTKITVQDDRSEGRTTKGRGRFVGRVHTESNIRVTRPPELAASFHASKAAGTCPGNASA